MKIAYICHPISGDVKRNIEKIKAICRDINLNHPEVIPFVPYMIDILCLDDDIPEERQRGMSNNMYYLENGYVDELWVYGHKVSDGMYEEINTALLELVPIVPMSEVAIKELSNL